MSRRLREELKQTKPFESLEQEVFLEIQRTAQVTARWVVEALKPSGLSPSQFNVLRILRGAGPEGLACGAVCERMVNHDPDLTRLLDRLEAAALVEKFRDAKDRRVVKARITKAGLRAVEKADSAARERLVGRLRSLGPRRLEMLADLLEMVRASIEPE